MSKPVLPPSTQANHALSSAEVIAVKQATFVSRYQSVWQQFDELCASMGVAIHPIIASAATPASHQRDKQAIKRARQASYPLIRLYRQICQHYALAKQRHYSPQLVAQLHERVMVGHQLIYQSKTRYVDKLLTFIFYGFPAQLRQHRRLFWLAFALFYVPFFLMLIGCYLNNELIYSVMSPDQVAEMEFMYNPANANIGRAMNRQADTDMMMFGVYVYNNISIDFRMYASGLFAGIGTIISTLYNGVVIGAVAGHLTQLGYGETFWPFVSGHSAFELTAAVIASCAGLRLAQPIISPYPYRRKDAFIIAGKQSIQILLGAALMTFIAAFIEAFWSSSKLIPNEVKFGVALLLWGLVTYYLTMAGRGYLVEGFESDPKSVNPSNRQSYSQPNAQPDSPPNAQTEPLTTANSLSDQLTADPRRGDHEA